MLGNSSEIFKQKANALGGLKNLGIKLVESDLTEIGNENSKSYKKIMNDIEEELKNRGLLS